MKDFFELFASKRVVKLFSTYVTFSFASFFKYWFTSVPLFVCLTVCFYHYKFPCAIGLASEWWFWVVLFLISSLPFFLINYARQSRFYGSPFGICIGITEPIIVESKEYLTVNYDTHKIASVLEEDLLKLVNSNLAFKKLLVNIALIRKPKLFYLSKSFIALKRSYVSQVYKQRYLAVLYVTIDDENKKISFDVSYNDQLANADDMFYYFKRSFSIIYDPQRAERYITEVCKVFAALHGQAVMEFLMERKEYILAHQILDDCESLLRSSFSVLDKLKVGSDEDFHALQKNILSSFEIYRCSLYTNQKEFHGAIRHIFKAILINPFYPFVTYEQYRDAFNKKYAAQLSSKYIQLNSEPEIREALGEDNLADNKMLDRNADALWQRVEYPDSPSFEDYIKGIMKDANSEEINREIETRIRTAFSESPVCEIIRGDVLKYLPKGDQRHNEMYVERIPEVVAEFEKVLEKDSEFVLMYTRIGVLQLIYAVEIEEQDPIKAKTAIEEATVMMKKGREIFSRLGMVSSFKDS